jgi:hypothetical protein
MVEYSESFEACVSRVAKAGKMSSTDAKVLLQQVFDRGENMRLTGAEDPYLKAAAEMAVEAVDAAKKDRLDALRNAKKRALIRNKITGFDNAAQVLRDEMHGSNVGGRDSVQARWLGKASTLSAAMDFKLKQEGGWEVAMTGELDRETSRAMWSINSGIPAKIGKLSKAIAEAYLGPLEELRNLMNSEGARIGKAADYVMHTMHDPWMMRRGGVGAPGMWVPWKKMGPDDAFNRWLQWTMPRLSEKTFESVEPKQGETTLASRLRFMRSVFDALVSGIHMTPEGAMGLPADDSGYVHPAFEGTRNIARKVSQRRVLFWKDGDAWYEYNSRYGRYRTLYDAVHHEIRQGSRNVALMHKFGTNPMANMNQIIRNVQEDYRSDLEGGHKFSKKIDGLRNVMGQLDGSANIPVNEMWHSLSVGVRQYYINTSLGGVGVTHFASIWATVPSELRHHGLGSPHPDDPTGLSNIPGTIANFGRTLNNLVKGKGPVERQEILHDLGAYADAYSYNVSRNWNLIFQPGNTPMGRLSALTSIFMRATGLPWVFDTTKAGVREALAANLGRQLGREFKELHPMLQNMLSKYDIDEPHWNQLRALQDVTTFNGRKYLTPKDAMRTPAGQELADRLMAYYQDAADHSIVAAGVKERAMIQGRQRPGDPNYEFRALLMQFKMWPLAALTQVVGREIYMNTDKKGALWGLGMVIAASTAAGFMRLAVNAAAGGKPMPDPTDPETLLSAFAKGGGTGLAGDLLFGEVHRLREHGLMAFAGPFGSDLHAGIEGFGHTLEHIYGKWKTSVRTEKEWDPWPEIARWGKRHIPFTNLIYLKGTLDYMLFYHMYEAVDPGWWQRANRRMAREHGETMYGYTPGGGVPRGVPGIYMQNQAGRSFGLLGQQ